MRIGQKEERHDIHIACPSALSIQKLSEKIWLCSKKVSDSSRCLVFFLDSSWDIEKILNIAKFRKKFWDSIWIVQGLCFFLGFCLDSFLGHRKMKPGYLKHLDRLLVYFSYIDMVFSIFLFPEPEYFDKKETIC